MTPFGKFLRRERQERGLLLGDMAKKLKISAPYLSQVETGNRAIPDEFEEKVIRIFSLNFDEANELRRAAALSRSEYQLKIETGSSDEDRALAYDLAASFARMTPEMKKRLHDFLKENGHA